MVAQKNFPIGISDFKKIMQGNYTLIDKSMFIKDVMENGAGVILITRPRRFGKTINMSMLHRFLELNGNTDLFEGLMITQHANFCEKHQNKYPVIFVSFKDVKAESWDESFKKLQEVFSSLYEEYADLLNGSFLSDEEKEKFQRIRAGKVNNPVELSYALVALIRYTARRYNISPILLLDEYDTPIHSAYSFGYYDKNIDFMRTLLGAALKDNSYLGKAVLTGITRVSKESFFSGLNNIEVHTMLDKTYAQYFGFTEEEVRSLLPEERTLESVREWYNGYTMGDQQLYNPWSIINCFKSDTPPIPYWVNTSDNALVLSLIEKSKPHIKVQFEDLIEGKNLKQLLQDNLTFNYLEGHEASLWTLLLHTGYLTARSNERSSMGDLYADLAIPNKEVMYIYNQIVRSWFTLKEQKLRFYDEFLESLEKGNVEIFSKHVQEYIKESGSYFDFSKNTSERVFHIFMLGLLVGLRHEYEISSNKEAGLGRYDIAFVPKRPDKRGILLEFKVCAKTEELEPQAQEALNQVQTKEYVTLFQSRNIQEVLVIGMAFCGKELKTLHRVLSL